MTLTSMLQNSKLHNIVNKASCVKQTVQRLPSISRGVSDSWAFLLQVANRNAKQLLKYVS